MTRPAKTKGELPLTSLLPNLVTVAAICAGLTAIRFAFQGSFEAAVTLILVAGVLDGLDGRLARMLKSESALGAELDSLADFLNFGIAPALILYVWAFQDMRNLGWIAIVIYALCCVLRLARFNIGNKSEVSEGPKKFFVGVPAPAGAMLVMLPMFLSFIWSRTPILPAGLIGLYMIGVGLLMVSRIPTWSLKATTIYRENVKYLVIGFVVLVAALFSFPWVTLVALDLAYFVGILWSLRSRNSSRAN